MTHPLADPNCSVCCGRGWIDVVPFPGNLASWKAMYPWAELGRGINSCPSCVLREGETDAERKQRIRAAEAHLPESQRHYSD